VEGWFLNDETLAATFEDPACLEHTKPDEELSWPVLADLEEAWDPGLIADLGSFVDLTRSAGWVGEEHRVTWPDGSA
jgi:hypothetical protein